MIEAREKLLHRVSVHPTPLRVIPSHAPAPDDLIVCITLRFSSAGLQSICKTYKKACIKKGFLIFK